VSIPGKLSVVRDLLRLGARYIVAAALFNSGIQMVLGLAGTHTGPVEWVTPLGEFSGAQFAGMWLGVSPVFQFLGGLVEAAAGLLLLSRRTTTLGALIAIGCIINSLMLRLCFGGSPWVSEALLLLPAIYLALLDWRVLFDLLLLDRPTVPAPIEGAWETPQARKFGLALKTAILLYFIYADGFQMIQAKQDASAQSELSGADSVASFSPPDAGLGHRWRVAAIDRYAERLTVRTADGAGTTFQIQPVVAPGARKGHREHVAAIAMLNDHIALVAPNGSVSALKYSRPSPGRLIVTGELDGGPISADLQMMQSNSLPFVGRDRSFAEPR
jgi:hypothetical protein